MKFMAPYHHADKYYFECLLITSNSFEIQDNTTTHLEEYTPLYLKKQIK